jgi:amino acid adenylation domain-containing protein
MHVLNAQSLFLEGPGGPSLSAGVSGTSTTLVTVKIPSAFHGGDIASAERNIATAWCVLTFRRLDQDVFPVEVFTAHQPSQAEAGISWEASRAEVTLHGDACADDVARAWDAARRQPQPAVADPLEPRPPVGFTWLSAGTPAAEALAREGRLPATPSAALHLFCVADGEATRCFLAFDSGTTSGPAATGLLSQLKAVVRAVATTPSAPVRTLPLMMPEESEALLRTLTGPIVAAADVPVFRAIERHAATHPNDVAIRLNGHTMTYAGLNARANRMAHWLASQGLTEGARVALLLEPSFDFVAAMLAVFKMGATHVPLEPSYPLDRLAMILDDVRPAVTLTEAALVARLGSSSNPTPLQTGVVAAIETLEEQLGRQPTENPERPIPPNGIAYIVYTSGTTGKPKGVMVTHANLAHYIAVAAATYRYGREDVIPAMARFTFSITFFELLSPLVAGGQLVLLERGHVLDLPRMAKTLSEITCIHCSPSLWRKLIQHLEAEGPPSEERAAAFARVRHVSSGGDMVPPDVLEGLKRLFPNAEVYVIYGSSEISCMGCTYLVPRERALTSTRVGKPFPNMRLRLLDAAGNVVPPGVIGEVCFGGAGLAQGYLDAPALTAEKFREREGERLYFMGDLGRLDEEGNLELVGRRDFQIKLRGIRIEPADIEANLRAWPGVRDVVVAAPTMPDGEKRLVAYVVPDPQQPPTPREMREFLKGKLPDYMVPAVFVLLESLPVNVNNKVDRLKLQNLEVVPGVTPSTDAAPPRNDTERVLLGLWEKVLGVKGLGVRDDFFDVGGDSLRSIALMSAIDRELGVALPVSSLVSAPTVEKLALLLGAQESDDGPPRLVCLRRGRDRRPPIFFVHDGDGETLPYRNLALRLHPDHTVYGLHPKSRRHHPILHTRIAEVVDDYVAQIRHVQPRGPYLLGGLCIGGFLAFEMGRKLRALGEMVAPIALIDVGHVSAPKKSMTSKRVGRFSRDLAALEQEPLLKKVSLVGRLLARRAQGMIAYELQSRYERRKRDLKLKLFRQCLDHDAPLPPFLRGISVDAALRFAEREFVVPGMYRGEALLFRATTRDPSLDGIVDDTPYIEIFEDPMLGWTDKAAMLRVYDVEAGHSSCLREPAVALIASQFQAHIDETLEAAGKPVLA